MFQTSGCTKDCIAPTVKHRDSISEVGKRIAIAAIARPRFKEVIVYIRRNHDKLIDKAD